MRSHVVVLKRKGMVCPVWINISVCSKKSTTKIVQVLRFGCMSYPIVIYPSHLLQGACCDGKPKSQKPESRKAKSREPHSREAKSQEAKSRETESRKRLPLPRQP
jgi:hypothetical protein